MNLKKELNNHKFARSNEVISASKDSDREGVISEALAPEELKSKARLHYIV